MYATAEIQVIPIGVGISLREPIKRAHALLVESGLDVETHGQGTNVEGELSAVLAAIERLHTVLHDEGVPRLATFVKIGTRTDKKPSNRAKVKAVLG